MKKRKPAPLDSIPSQILADIGRAVFGQHWQVPLAKALKVHDRTLRRWANDGGPLELTDPLRVILEERQKEIHHALGALAELREEAA
jgi:hypothetical protein